jgi:membrane protease YdiL (CAAX protease family)
MSQFFPTDMYRLVAGIATCILVSTIFVSSLYVWGANGKGRDHPWVMKRRFASVVVSTVIAWVITWWFTGKIWYPPPLNISQLSQTTLQVFLLMLGPIYQQRKDLSRLPRIDIYLLRTVFVAPVFEELVFRQFFWLILETSGFERISASLVGPILFALAHVHHHVGKQSMISIIAKIAHTCIFGWLGFYFLIYRSVWDSILAHALCNYIGLPSNSMATPANLVIYSVGLVSFIASIY